MTATEITQKKEELLTRIEVLIWKYLHVTTEQCTEEQANEDARLMRKALEAQITTSETIAQAKKILGK